MPKCELCGKETKTTQGLRGHMTFRHQVIGSGRQPVARLATEQELGITQQQLGELEQQLSELEGQLGLSEFKQPLGVWIAYIWEYVLKIDSNVNRLLEAQDELGKAQETIGTYQESTKALQEQLAATPELPSWDELYQHSLTCKVHKQELSEFLRDRLVAMLPKEVIEKRAEELGLIPKKIIIKSVR